MEHPVGRDKDNKVAAARVCTADKSSTEDNV